MTLGNLYGVNYVTLEDGFQVSLFFEWEGEVTFGPDAWCEEMRRDLTREEGAQIEALVKVAFPGLEPLGLYW